MSRNCENIVTWPEGPAVAKCNVSPVIRMNEPTQSGCIPGWERFCPPKPIRPLYPSESAFLLDRESKMGGKGEDRVRLLGHSLLETFVAYRVEILRFYYAAKSSLFSSGFGPFLITHQDGSLSLPAGFIHLAPLQAASRLLNLNQNNSSCRKMPAARIFRNYIRAC